MNEESGRTDDFLRVVAPRGDDRGERVGGWRDGRMGYSWRNEGEESMFGMTWDGIKRG